MLQDTKINRRMTRTENNEIYQTYKVSGLLRWLCKWDKHQRALLFDGLPHDALAFHTDFSAKYACVGQDEATCSHPNTCNQQVFE